jgi:hypothetical protein
VVNEYVRRRCRENGISSAKGGSHVTEGVRCALARFLSVMYEIVLRVTP